MDTHVPKLTINEWNIMLYARSLLLTGVAVFSTALASNRLVAQNIQKDYSTKAVGGSLTNGLLSNFEFIPSDRGWGIDIALTAQTNFPAHTWLKITNHVGSKLELWQTNGVPVVSKSPDVLAAFHLPQKTIASEILNFHPRRGRVYQWWLVGRPVFEGTSEDTADFKLESAFDISPTNDYVLQIVPLIYKVETNEIAAHLVEFAPIKVKLMANGSIQKLQ
jgi:hypothetical protein